MTPWMSCLIRTVGRPTSVDPQIVKIWERLQSPSIVICSTNLATWESHRSFLVEVWMLWWTHLSWCSVVACCSQRCSYDDISASLNQKDGHRYFYYVLWEWKTKRHKERISIWRAILITLRHACFCFGLHSCQLWQLSIRSFSDLGISLPWSPCVDTAWCC